MTHDKAALRGSRRSVIGGLATGAAATLLPSFPAFGQLPEWPGPKRPRFAPMVVEFKMNLPAGKAIGPVTAIAYSPVTEDIFLLQHPTSPTSSQGPPKEAQLPFIVRLDKNGNFITAFGGAEYVPTIDGVNQWPTGVENIECDDEGNIYATGWHPQDDVVLKFSPDGKYLKQYGARGKDGSDTDPKWLGSPPSVYHDVKNRELFIADGYGNHRIIAVNSDTGEMTRMWGAYGKPPESFDYKAGPATAYGAMPGAPTREVGWATPVHKVTMAPDGKILVASRPQCKIQEFELIPGGAKYIREVIVAPGTDGLGSAADIAVTPDNKFMYVSDMRTGVIWIVDRQEFRVLGWVNATPQTEGSDDGSSYQTLHRFCLMPNGDLFLGRTMPRKVFYLKYLGVF